MSNNRLEITVNIAKFSKNIGAKLGQATEKISFDVHGKIIKETPVKTGRARASFDVAIGQAPTRIQPAVKNFKKGDAPLPAPEFDPGGKIDGTKPVFIVSNVPYVEHLENGSSQKAPAGMVRVSLAGTVAELDTILANLDE